MYQVFQLKIIELYYAFFVLIQWMIVKISMTFFSWLSLAVCFIQQLFIGCFTVQLYKQISKGNTKNNAKNRFYLLFLLNCSLI